MIVDFLEQAERYQILHPRLSPGFRFLQRGDLADLADGEYEIEGQQVYAIVARGKGRGRENAPLEVHKRYIDIHYVVEGQDEIGWCHQHQCHRVSTPYDAERDVEFYYDRPLSWLRLPAGSFSIFFPHDAHAPFATADKLQKVVIKVQL